MTARLERPSARQVDIHSVLGDEQGQRPEVVRRPRMTVVLATLADNERYGFELVSVLSDARGLQIAEGTVYPLLSRLRRDGLVATTWRESDSGPPRRYYRMTPAGQKALAGFKDDWCRFRDAVDGLLGTGGHHDD